MEVSSQTEEEAIQQYRNLLAAGGTSSEFQNFAAGMKKALSTSATDYKQAKQEKPSTPRRKK